MEGILIFLLILAVTFYLEARYEKKSALALFVDAEREPPRTEGPWDVARTASNAAHMLMKRNYRTVVLDFDLGPDAGTGHDVLEWLEATAALGWYVPDDIRISAVNPVARARMEEALTAIRRHKTLRASEFFVDRHGQGE